MKTKSLFFCSLLIVAICMSANAQVTEANNTPVATSFVGTSNNQDVIFKRQSMNAGLLSTSTTSFGLKSFASPNTVSIGVGAGEASSGIGSNVNIGMHAGSHSVGYGNSFLGFSAGYGATGTTNTFLGGYSGYNSIGNFNIIVGNNVGEDLVGSNNVIIGNNQYLGLDINNKLFVENFEEGEFPLIWGDFALDQLKLNAKVGIGHGFGNYPTTAGSVDVSAYNLFVKGGVLTEEVRVMLQADWADYVFTKDYKLSTLAEVEAFIAKNGHLPNVPSAQQVKEDGIELGEMAKIQQEKIEELTLYILQLNKENERQAKENAALNERLLKLESMVNTLTK